MSQFYEKIEKEALSFCEGALLSVAQREFEGCDDPKKRFSFPTFLYSLEGRVSYESLERDLLTVRLTATLSRRGEGTPRERNTDGHAWSLSEERMLPPTQVADALGARRLRRRERKGMAGIYVEGGELWLCKDGRVYAVGHEKSKKSRQNR